MPRTLISSKLGAVLDLLTGQGKPWELRPAARTRRRRGVADAIAAIDEDAWTNIDYTPDGEAQVAECVYQNRRLVVRRTRLTDTRQARLWPDWRHFGFLTDLTDDTRTVRTRLIAFPGRLVDHAGTMKRPSEPRLDGHGTRGSCVASTRYAPSNLPPDNPRGPALRNQYYADNPIR